MAPVQVGTRKLFYFIPKDYAMNIKSCEITLAQTQAHVPKSTRRK